jgi:rhamnosyltransferase
VVVPTLNAAKEWAPFRAGLLAAVPPEQVLVIDSSSMDGTAALAGQAGFLVHSIPRAEFNHGATRQLAADMLRDAEILVYMTQDAVLAAPEAISKLLSAFDDPRVGSACGRQLPRPGAVPVEAHARTFNYPPVSSVRSFADRERFGIKSVFLSNSFAAYRRSALMSVGGFPTDVIFGEDMIVAAKLLLAGYNNAYVAEACVYHSHSYTHLQEFKRYFDVGVLHAREHELLGQFGGANGEGRRFVVSELRYLMGRAPLSIPGAIVRTAGKLAGYRLGKAEGRLTPSLKSRLSMNAGYWSSPHASYSRMRG